MQFPESTLRVYAKFYSVYTLARLKQQNYCLSCVISILVRLVRSHRHDIFVHMYTALVFTRTVDDIFAFIFCHIFPIKGRNYMYVHVGAGLVSRTVPGRALRVCGM